MSESILDTIRDSKGAGKGGRPPAPEQEAKDDDETVQDSTGSDASPATDNDTTEDSAKPETKTAKKKAAKKKTAKKKRGRKKTAKSSNEAISGLAAELGEIEKEYEDKLEYELRKARLRAAKVNLTRLSKFHTSVTTAVENAEKEIEALEKELEDGAD